MTLTEIILKFYTQKVIREEGNLGICYLYIKREGRYFINLKAYLVM